MSKRMKYSELHGRKFGRYTVIADLPKGPNFERFVLCECECGNQRRVLVNNLKRGHSKSCGCDRAELVSKRMFEPFSELEGRIFGRLTIVSDFGTSASGRIVLCKCECGKEKRVRVSLLKKGSTKSCGCLAKELLGKTHLIHGLTGHPLHTVWNSMIQRCYDPKCEAYPNYGGRGVIVSDEWLNNFKCFYDWAMSNGWKRGLQIDKDTKGDGLLYGPDTCCILTRSGNMRKTRANRLVTYNGEVKTMVEWCEILGLKYHLTGQRIDRDGWSIEKAFNKTS